MTKVINGWTPEDLAIIWRRQDLNLYRYGEYDLFLYGAATLWADRRDASVMRRAQRHPCNFYIVQQLPHGLRIRLHVRGKQS
jgi:hypothetical protein